MGKLIDILEEETQPKKKSKFADIIEAMPEREISRTKPLPSREYQDVPSRQEYRGTTAGYTAKRYLGGPLMRGMEAFFQEQNVMAILTSLGDLSRSADDQRMPEDWNVGTPWAKIIYPGRYLRISEAAVTGTTTPWVNFGFALATSPSTYLGGASTKAGTAAKLIDGLTDAGKLKKVAGTLSTKAASYIDEAEKLGDIRQVFKNIGASEGPQGIKSFIKEIVPAKQFKKYEPLAQGYEKYGERFFDKAVRTSEKIRTGKQNVMGLGFGAGYGAPTDIDVLGRLRNPVADAWEWYEDLKQFTRGRVGLTRIGVQPRMVNIKDIARREEAVKGLKEFGDIGDVKKRVGQLTRRLNKYESIAGRLEKDVTGFEASKGVAEVGTLQAIPKAVEPVAGAGKGAKPPSKKIGIEMLYHGESRRAQYARSQGMKPISDIVKETGLPKKFLKDAGFLKEKGEWHHVMRGNKLVEEFFQDMPDAEKLLDLRRGYRLFLDQQSAERKLPKSGRIAGSEDLWKKYDDADDKYIKWREGDLSEEELSKIVIKAPPKPIDTAVKSVAEVKAKPTPPPDVTEKVASLNKVNARIAAVKSELNSAVNKVNQFADAQSKYFETLKDSADVTRFSNLDDMIQKMRTATEANARAKAIKFGQKAVKGFSNILYANAKTPDNVKQVNRMFADVIANPEKSFGIEADALRGVYNALVQEIMNNEALFKTYTPIANYIPRIIKMMGDRAWGEKSIPAEFLEHISGPIGQIAKRMGLKNEWTRLRGGEAFISVTNPHHYARAQDKYKSVEELVQLAMDMKSQAIEKNNLKLANEITDGMQPLLRMQRVIKEGIEEEWSPHKVNEFFRKGMPDDIDGFIKSKRGRRLGFKDDNTIDDWEFFDEDFRKIVPERGIEYGKTMASGEVLARFLNQFGLVKDDIARSVAARAGDSKKIVDELGVYDYLARTNNAFKGRPMVNMKEHMTKNGIILEGSVNKIIGNILGGRELDSLHMDVDAADAFIELLKAHIRLPNEGAIAKGFDKFNRYWAKMILFGGRTTYLMNNLTGDRWHMFLAGADPKYIWGGRGAQLMLPEGKSFTGLDFIKGLSDDDVLVIGANGIHYTKGKIKELINTHDIDGGLFDSILLESVDKAYFKGAPRSADMVKRLTGGFGKHVPEPTAPFVYLSQYIEKNGRYSLFMDGLEKGMSPAEAAARVNKYLFDYSKQNPTMRRIAPFYYWMSNAVPLNFSNMVKQPGKQMAPYKVQNVMSQWAGDREPHEESKSPYNAVSGVWAGSYNDGKTDVYISLQNIPPYASQEVLGIMNNDDNIVDILREATIKMAGMTNPLIQLTLEFAFNKDVHTGQPILSGGAGVMPERGEQKFLGIRVEGIKWQQGAVHVSRTFIPQADLVDRFMKRRESPTKKLPPVWEGLKTAGFPVYSGNRLSWERINTQREKNEMKALQDRYKHIRDEATDPDARRSASRKYNDYKQKVSKLQTKLTQIDKKLEIEKNREESLKRRERKSR